jgi:arylsulfatase A-like enzyme
LLAGVSAIGRSPRRSPKSELKAGQFSFIEPLKSAGYRNGLSGKNHVFQPDYAKKDFDFFQEYSPWGKDEEEMGSMNPSDQKPCGIFSRPAARNPA